MAAYCGSIGSVNVLELVSTDLFDESQENPFLLQNSSPNAKLRAPTPSPVVQSPGPKRTSIRFAELPLGDQLDLRRCVPSPVKPITWSPQSSPPKRPSVVVPTPISHQPPPQYQPSPLTPVYARPELHSPSVSPQATSRQSITITLPFGAFPRQTSDESHSSSSTMLTEEAELHKLLYSLSQLGLGQQPPVAPAPSRHSIQQQQQQPPPPSFQQDTHVHDSYTSTVSAPTSPAGYNASSLWLPASAPTHEQVAPRSSGNSQGTASLMFRPLPSRQSRRITKRQSNAARRHSSASNSPGRDSGDEGLGEASATDVHAGGDDFYYDYGSQPSSPQHSRGSVTFLTVKNLLRGGGALARTMRREQSNRRPTCVGSELTVSSRLKRREKFQRSSVVTDAYLRVSGMKLGTSPMKVGVKHKAFPETWSHGPIDHHDEVDAGMPSPKGQLRRESLITLETLDKIGTRHACPVQLIEEPLPDFSAIQPRVDTWNHIKKPKQNLRRPSAWLLSATATSTPHALLD